MDCSPPGSSCPWNSPGNNTGVGCRALLHDPPWLYLPNPGIKPRSPMLQVDSLLPEPPGKPNLYLEIIPDARLLLLLLSRFSRVQLCSTQRQQPTCSCDSPGKNTGVGCHFLLQCMKVKSESEVVQSCPTLSDPMDCSLPGSSVHGIFQAGVLEWGAIAFSMIPGRSLIIGCG